MNINTLIGKTLSRIEVFNSDDEIYFYEENGNKYKMFHEQDCCECVFIEDVCGNLEDLVGTPILIAEEVTEVGEGTHKYKLATAKGYVTIRWYGEPNGYYSVEVSFKLVE